MAFLNYYLRIDGVQYPNSNMVIPSYSVKDEPIIVNSYYDANYNRHIVKAPKNDIEIEFKIRSLFNDEFAQSVTPFKDTMTIEYYNPKTNAYLTDTFTYDGSLQPSIARQYNSRVLFNELQIKLVRKAQ